MRRRGILRATLCEDHLRAEYKKTINKPKIAFFSVDLFDNLCYNEVIGRAMPDFTSL